MNGLIQSIFAKSPLKPIVKHIKRVHECSEHLVPFFKAVHEDNWDLALKEQQEIKRLENEADEIKRKIRIKLPSGLFMPIERTDLLELVSLQDNIANDSKDIAGIVLGRQLKMPSDLEEQFFQYLTRTVEAVSVASKVIGELDNLLETGFRGKEVQIVSELAEKIDRIESDTDDLQIELRHALYKRENEMNTIDAIFIYNILDKIGDLANQAEQVGSKLAVSIARD